MSEEVSVHPDHLWHAGHQFITGAYDAEDGFAAMHRRLEGAADELLPAMRGALHSTIAGWRATAVGLTGVTHEHGGHLQKAAREYVERETDSSLSIRAAAQPGPGLNLNATA